MRDVRHVECFLPKLPLDIAIVRESIHKRTEYEAPRPFSAVNAAHGCAESRESRERARRGIQGPRKDCHEPTKALRA
jgi:hypothetical protein